MVKSDRKGMELWEILVLGVMRQELNVNYDRIHYLANSDIVINFGHKMLKKRGGITPSKSRFISSRRQCPFSNRFKFDVGCYPKMY